MASEATPITVVPVVEEPVQVVEVNGGETPAPAPAAVEEPVVEEKKIIDPREDPIGWVSSLIPAGVHKANHEVLTWLQNTVVEKEEDKQVLPGKDGLVTKSQFVNFLKDGTLLANLANKLSPGSVEKVHEGEEAKTKENQTANLESFVTFLKEKAGFSEEQVFAPADVQDKGKAAYNSVFNAVFQLGLQAKDKLNVAGIDVDAVVEAASQAVKSSFLQTLLNFFKRARPQLKSKDEKENNTSTEEAVPATNGDTPKTTEETATANGNGNGNGATPVVVTTQAVAAN